MKNIFLYLFLITAVSCNTESGTNDRVIASENTCKSIAVEDFKSFLSIRQSTAEVKLKEILGKSTGGSYSDDKTTFIYQLGGLNACQLKYMLMLRVEG